MSRPPNRIRRCGSPLSDLEAVALRVLASLGARGIRVTADARGALWLAGPVTPDDRARVQAVEAELRAALPRETP